MSPTSSPTSGLKKISVDSSLQWNITSCDELRGNATALLSLAKVIEESIYNGVDPQLTTGEDVESVLVYELCGEDVPDHEGFSMDRRLQFADSSNIGVLTVVSKTCLDCQEVMFTDTKEALESIVNDGSLITAIGTTTEIGNAAFNPGVVSTFTRITDSPTASPTVSSSPSGVPSLAPSSSQKPSCI